jgi:hypothetical protein
LLLAGVVLVATGCQGQTDQPQDVTDTTAKLMAKNGYADIGATYYYFRYSKTADWPNGPIVQTPERGPIAQGTRAASWGELVTGLDPGTSYTYEVCGGEVGPPRTLYCGDDVTFTTQPSVSGNIRTVRGVGAPPCDLVCPTPQPTVDGSAALTSQGSANQVRAYPPGGYLLALMQFAGTSDQDVIGIVEPTQQDPDGIITRVAGTGAGGCTGDGGDARQATLAFPQEAMGLPNGGLLIADYFCNKIRYVTPTQSDGVRQIYTIAGNGQQCPPADPPGKRLSEPMCGEGGDAIDAAVDRPLSVSIIPSESDFNTQYAHFSFYVDSKPNRILKVTDQVLSQTGLPNPFAPRAKLYRVAGNGLAATDPCDEQCPQNFAGDAPQPVDGARLNGAGMPRAWPGGGFVFNEGSSCRIRRVDPSGTLTTLAGAGAYHGNGPSGPWCYADHKDSQGHSVQPSLSDGLLATQVWLQGPQYYDVTSAGELVISQIFGHRVRFVSAPNAQGHRIITTIAGNGTLWFDDDTPRPARTAKLAYGSGLTLYRRDGVNGFLITDNNRIRFVEAPNLTAFEP